MLEQKLSLTISGHAHGETLLKAAVLTAVSVHAHDQTIFILNTHLVVDILLDTASEETLEGVEEEIKYACWCVYSRFSEKEDMICVIDLVGLTLQPSQACTP